MSKNNSRYKSTNNCILTKDGKKLVLSRNHNILDSVTEIGDYAFSGCTSLKSIMIPNSVTSIGEFAFNCCTSLQSIDIPDSVTQINGTIFSDCNNLTSIIVSKNNSRYKSTNNCILTKDGKKLVLCRNHNIPNGITEIGRFAFSGCTSLQSIEIVTQEKELDLSLERIEYLLQALSEYSKEFSLRVPISCDDAYRHYPAFEGKFKTIIADIDA